jgi:hypothetical protein
MAHSSSAEATDQLMLPNYDTPDTFAWLGSTSYREVHGLQVRFIHVHITHQHTVEIKQRKCGHMHEYTTLEDRILLFEAAVELLKLSRNALTRMLFRGFWCAALMCVYWI